MAKPVNMVTALVTDGLFPVNTAKPHKEAMTHKRYAPLLFVIHLMGFKA